jgi:predicted enzyme related to lactoylglutathione lyase
MAAAIELVLDCADLETQARFWAAALGYEPVGTAGQYRALAPPAGQTGPRLILQQVPEPRTTKNRMHVDVLTDDVAAEADRLLGLGARVRGDVLEEHGYRWLPMADPEGNEFCVCACG